MRAVLTESAAIHGITNLDLLPLRWPKGSESVHADFSLVAHVGYDIREILPFLEAVEGATAERCFWVLMDRAPSSGFNRLWAKVHGEPRCQLPGMSESCTAPGARCNARCADLRAPGLANRAG